MFKLISKKIYSSADILLLTSKAFKGKLLDMAVTKPKLEYFPQWIERNYLDSPNIGSSEFKEVKKIFNKFDNKKIFLFAGNIGESQNFSNLLTSFANVKNQKDFVFLIIGDGRYKEKLIEQIEKLNLSKNVLLLGKIPKSLHAFILRFC